MHQGYQPQWGVDHWRSHCHHHRRQLLRWPTSRVWHHARMERGMISIIEMTKTQLVEAVEIHLVLFWNLFYSNKLYSHTDSLVCYCRVLIISFLFLCNPADHSSRHPRPDSTSAHPRCCGSHAVLQVQAILQRCPWEICLYWWVKTLPSSLPLFPLFPQASLVPPHSLPLLPLSGWSPQPQVQALIMN